MALSKTSNVRLYFLKHGKTLHALEYLLIKFNAFLGEILIYHNYCTSIFTICVYIKCFQLQLSVVQRMHAKAYMFWWMSIIVRISFGRIWEHGTALSRLSWYEHVMYQLQASIKHVSMRFIIYLFIYYQDALSFFLFTEAGILSQYRFFLYLLVTISPILPIHISVLCISQTHQHVRLQILQGSGESILNKTLLESVSAIQIAHCMSVWGIQNKDQVRHILLFILLITSTVRKHNNEP